MAQGDQTKVLVIEEFAPMRKIIHQQLAKLGFESVVEAENIGQAEQIMSTSVDWNMVICSASIDKNCGIRFLERLRLNPHWTSLPFIMVASNRNSGTVREAINKGVSAYITKPFTINTLRQRIEKMGVRP